MIRTVEVAWKKNNKIMAKKKDEEKPKGIDAVIAYIKKEYGTDSISINIGHFDTIPIFPSVSARLAALLDENEGKGREGEEEDKKGRGNETGG